MSDLMQEAIDTLTELKRMHQLNFELIEQLNIICQWIVDNNIKVPNEDALRSLVGKSLSLITEIQVDEPKILTYNISRRKVTDFREYDGTDEEVPVPFKGFW